MTIIIKNLSITLAPPARSSFVEALLKSAIAVPPEPDDNSAEADAPPRIGEIWPGQGGIFAGDFRADDGTIYGLIVPNGIEDAGAARWAPSGQLTLSDWDGLTNTQSLKDCPAAALATEFQRDGHTDFYLPARRELLLAAANVPHIFGKSSWYWTSTPSGEHYAWAVGFEGGICDSYDRSVEFRVRPFRSVRIDND